MKAIKILALAVAAAVAFSCATVKQVPYFHDIAAGGNDFSFARASEIMFEPGDKIYITVNCRNEELRELFNISGATRNYNNLAQSGVKPGYVVDDRGCIEFPMLGKLKIEGLTRQKTVELIERRLEEENLVKDPIVMIDYMNLTYSMFGEVRSPGQYNIEKDLVTITDAISKAGDLQITAQRPNVKVIREIDGKKHVYEINLNKAEDVFSSPAYYLKQNDLVYVEPNKKKAREATVNGNTLLTPGFYISIASFIMSVLTFAKLAPASK